ncbi:RNA/RNP complex-1-interacting phosphatase [Oryzias melastigma]|uniref:RNA/RNP complex-1-interacting phosphatase n=1 Tax=Oryzias melastigma TaxID=30732 RepID=A0A3B3BFI9_ORYME|nr:RNA/RNP complex-1-interacting phosphatase [Oryzias melastigma]
MSRKYQKTKKKNDIPDRWLDYSPVGKRLPGTRFIAFKVPLKQALNQKLPASAAFGPWELLDAVSRDRQELGLIIDLTFTSRYYGPQDLPESLRVVKIFTVGHQVPSNGTILSFKRAVRNFLRQNQNNDKLIGVHCTHGLNRTGYLICRYLIDVDGMEPAAAVKLFNSSRGHAMERKNYLDDLHQGPKRSNAGMEELEEEPKRGQATSRPTPTETPPGLDDAASYRSFPPNINSWPRPQPERPHPVPPRPPLFQPYRWGAPPPHSDWRRHPHPETNQFRPPPPSGPAWRPPHAPPEGRRWPAPQPHLQYSPSWAAGEEDWTPPGWRQSSREGWWRNGPEF